MSADAEKPSSLFKYQPLTPESIGNLASRAIYFCSPRNFNDPYDCAIGTKLKRITYPDLKRYRDQLIASLPNGDPLIELVRKFTVSEFRNHLEARLYDAIEKQRAERVSKIGVACFSETPSEMLMWSHYAARGRGFCLEFDSSAEAFQKARKVNYRTEFPELDGLRMLMDLEVDQFYELLRTKSHHWGYEREWRTFHTQAGSQIYYGAKDLLAVYFGPEMTKGSQNAIALILAGLHSETKLLKGERSPHEFNINFVEAKFSTATRDPQQTGSFRAIP